MASTVRNIGLYGFFAGYFCTGGGEFLSACGATSTPHLTTVACAALIGLCPLVHLILLSHHGEHRQHRQQPQRSQQKKPRSPSSCSLGCVRPVGHLGLCHDGMLRALFVAASLG